MVELWKRLLMGYAMSIAGDEDEGAGGGSDDKAESDTTSQADDKADDTAGQETVTEGQTAESQNTDTTSQTGKAEPGPVPYHVFKAKNDEAKQSIENVRALERKNAEYEWRLKQLEEAKIPPKSEEPLFKDPTQQAYYETYIVPGQERMKQGIMEQLNRLEAKLNKQDEEKVIAQTEKWIETETVKYKEQFPMLDPVYVRAALIARPQIPIAKIAEESHNYMKSLKARWEQEYLGGKKENAKTQGKAPAGSSPTSTLAQGKPGTFANATAKVVAALSRRGE